MVDGGGGFAGAGDGDGAVVEEGAEDGLSHVYGLDVFEWTDEDVLGDDAVLEDEALVGDDDFVGIVGHEGAEEKESADGEDELAHARTRGPAEHEGLADGEDDDRRNENDPVYLAREDHLLTLHQTRSLIHGSPLYGGSAALNPMRKRCPHKPTPFLLILFVNVFLRHVFIGVNEKFILRRTWQALKGLVCIATADTGVCTPCRMQAPRMEIVVASLHCANLPPDPTNKINEHTFDVHGNLQKKSALRPLGGTPATFGML